MSINIFSVPGLIAWLEGQDPEGRYEYGSINNCLGAQYCHDHGLGYGSCEGNPVPTANKKGSFREKLEYVACSAHPSTYGAALARAKEMVA